MLWQTVDVAVGKKFQDRTVMADEYALFRFDIWVTVLGRYSLPDYSGIDVFLLVEGGMPEYFFVDGLVKLLDGMADIFPFQFYEYLSGSLIIIGL